MPFTFSHPALIVPILYARRRYQWLSATGLIIGSMAPDAEKFFRLKLASQHSHTVASIFYFSCPVAIGLSFVFHGLVRRPLIAHVPAFLHRRLSKYANFNWYGYYRRHPLGVLLCIMAGAALHLLWDSFTHDNPLLTSVVPDAADLVWVGNKPMPIWQLIALGSSVGGGLVICWAVWRMPVRLTEPMPSGSAIFHYWGIVALVATVLEAAWVLAVHPRLLSEGIAAISATLVGVVVASLCVSRWSKRSDTAFQKL
jgi:hypothetical protein